MLAAHGLVLPADVELVSGQLGQVPSSRVKNTVTITEKLRRSGGHTLGSIHDLGGTRLVVTGGRDEQDRVAERICRRLLARPEPWVIDRRLELIQGYRGLHVIVYHDGYLSEVQVRTEWQHLWAYW